MDITLSGKLINLYKIDGNQERKIPERWAIQVLTDYTPEDQYSQAKLETTKLPKNTNPNPWMNCIGATVQIKMETTEQGGRTYFYIAKESDIAVVRPVETLKEAKKATA